MSLRRMTWSESIDWMRLARLVLLIATGLAITNLGLPQWATGPLVNALLLLTVAWGGVPEAIALGMVTPMGAAIRGVLPLPLLVMIPFIAVANAVLVSAYAGLRRRRPLVAVVVAAACKFAVLYAAIFALTVAPLSLVGTQVAIPQAFAQMMQWPQLLTALAGGLIALGIDRLPDQIRKHSA